MSLEDAVLGQYTYLRPSSMHGLCWKDDATFTFIKDNKLYAEDAALGHQEVVLELAEISLNLNKELNYFPSYRWLNSNELLFVNSSELVVLDLESRNVLSRIKLPLNAENANYSREGNFVSYTIENDLYLSRKDGSSIQITIDGGNGIVNGKSVHRNEFGISGGIFNSPKGNNIAFYRKDESMVKDYPLVDYMSRQAESNLVKYPMAGMESHHVKLGVYNLKKGTTVFLKTGAPFDHYLTNVSWSPNEEHIYLAELNREQNHMQLNCYDVATGEKLKTLFEEKSERYVEPLFPIRFSEVKPNEFYYLSRNDGWFHVYQYNTEGELLKQITSGDWEVTRILGFDKKEKVLFVEGTLNHPLEKHIYKIDVKSGEVEALSPETGVHTAKLSPSGDFVIDTWNAKDVAGRTDVINTKSGSIRTLHKAKDPLADYFLGENKLVELKTKNEDFDLFGRLILPNDFDPLKKYPVIVYVYGGPHSQLVTKGWHNAARWWQYHTASKGYIAFTLDNRGTNHRGRDFETAIHRKLGELETEDQMQGIEYLKSLPYVDQERIGVHGWSYGGFMTLNLMLKYPEIFRVGVAGGPVVDWKMYEIMYGERYMDMPQENPEGYANSEMTRYVKHLDGKLMLIHGAQDATVVMQHSMKFLRECIKQGKQVDFFTYPIHPHNVRGRDRVHLMEKVSQYFFDNL